MEKGPNASIGAQRFLIWLAIAGALLFGFAYIGLVRFFPPPPADLTADQVVALYTTHNVRLRIGVIVGLIAGGFLVPFSLVISVQMARLEKGIPIWAILQGATGTIGSIFIWMPMVIWGVAAFSPERPPELTLIFHEFSWLFYITTLSLFPMQLLGIIKLAFTKDEPDSVSAFPRWLGYLTAWQLVQSFGGPMAMLFKTGIFSWGGLLPFWIPFSLFGAWYAAICWTMLRALRHQRTAEIGAGAGAGA
jgi:hypothetical protein